MSFMRQVPSEVFRSNKCFVSNSGKNQSASVLLNEQRQLL